MSIVEDLAKGGVQGIGEGIASAARGLREAITGKAALTSDEVTQLELKARDIELAAMQADAAIAQAQAATNTAEAQSASFFRAGWRPAVGWVCVAGLAYQFIIRPLAPALIHAVSGHAIDLPTLDMGSLLTLLSGMLGLGGLRTFEKLRGLA